MIKQWDFGEYILEYEVEDNRTSTVYTDHTGRDILINHLWFYDPEMIWDIFGTTEVTLGQATDWFLANRSFLKSLRVRKEMLKEFFCSDHPFEEDLSVLSTSELLLFTNVSSPSSTPSFYFNLFGERADKPTLKVIYFYSYGRITTSGNTTPTESNQWNKHWNYTHRMDEDSYNFFRKTKKDTPYSPQYGLELEVNTRLSSEEIQYIVTEVEPKQEPFFIFKQDSSISGQFDNYYELVTVPCSYRYHRKAWKTFFGKLEKLCEDKGVTVGEVFDISSSLSNGLHIHVSRDSFYSQNHERKFLTIFNQWDTPTINFLQKISKRPTPYTENHYCNKNPEYHGRTLAQRLKIGSSSGRYLVHNQNPKTIEVRLFQGIFDLDHVLSCLDFTDAMLEFSLDVPYSGINMHFKQKFFEFIGKTPRYKVLKEAI